MSNSDTVDGMAKKTIKTVPVHARLPESDVEKIDQAAADELISRSSMIARVVREWAKRFKPEKPRK